MINYKNQEYLLLLNNTHIHLSKIENNTTILDSKLSEDKIILDVELNTKNLNLAISYTNNKVLIYNLESIIKDKKSETCLNSISIIKHSNYITKMKYTNNGDDLLLVTSINEILKYNSNKGLISISESNNSKDFFKKYAPSNLITWYNKIQDIIEIRENFFIAYTDYNFIPIYSDVKMPEKSVVIKDISSRMKSKNNSSVIIKYHEKVLTNSLSKNKQALNSEEKNELETLNFSIFTKFNSNVFMKYVDNNLVVLEVEWEKILNKFIKPVVVKRLNN
jgi:hypothetical protein